MSGIYPKLLSPEGVIDLALWTESVDTLQMVGTCVGCRGAMRGEPVRHERYITWYTATCVSCWRQVSAPNGRLLSASRRAYAARPR